MWFLNPPSPVFYEMGNMVVTPIPSIEGKTIADAVLVDSPNKGTEYLILTFEDGSQVVFESSDIDEYYTGFSLIINTT